MATDTKEGQSPDSTAKTRTFNRVYLLIMAGLLVGILGLYLVLAVTHNGHKLGTPVEKSSIDLPLPRRG